MSERRDFLKNTALVGAGSMLAPQTQAIAPPARVANAEVRRYKRLGGAMA